MAANSSSRGVANLGKRLLNHQICKPSPLSAPSLRRGNHTSVYDKNVEDNVRPVIVPDDITHPGAEKFWSPNPNNGIFGPPSENNPTGEQRGLYSSRPNGGSESVLEVKTFIRSLEDLDKPQHP